MSTMAEKEYIEREAAFRAILGQPPEPHYPEWYYRNIKELPAADVVEVVRCEHCKHSWFNGVSLWLCQREANSYCPTVKADAFCSYGERKEQNNV